MKFRATFKRTDGTYLNITDFVAVDIDQALTEARRMVSTLRVHSVEEVEESTPADLGLEAVRQDDLMTETAAMLESYVSDLEECLRGDLEKMDEEADLDGEHRGMVRERVAGLVAGLADEFVAGTI
jgi:hypothetical protein